MEKLQEAYDLSKKEFDKIGLTVRAEKSKPFLPNYDAVPLEAFIGVPRILPSSGLEVPRRVGDTVVLGLFEVPAAVDFFLPHALHAPIM